MTGVSFEDTTIGHLGRVVLKRTVSRCPGSGKIKEDGYLHPFAARGRGQSGTKYPLQLEVEVDF